MRDHSQKIFLPFKYNIDVLIALLVIVLAGVITYCNSFQGVFVFDDTPNIVENSSITELWPFEENHTIPPGVVKRPIINLSLSVSYWLSKMVTGDGLNTWGYHLLNILIHISAALVLLGIIKRTLTLDRFPQHYKKNSSVIACSISLIWLVHPIQTGSVTYTIQRCESLMGLFYLGTIFFAVCGLQSQRRRYWFMMSILSCALGMATKEVMITAPLLVILYDRMYVSNSFKNTLKENKLFYLALFSCWTIMAIIQSATPMDDSSGFGFGVTPLQYLITQLEVIPHYAKLVLVPTSLCLDYSWPLAKAINWPGGLFIFIFFIAATWTFFKNHPFGFILIYIFLTLAPSSSVFPIKDFAFEHRLYLPLAGVITIALIALYTSIRYLFKKLHLKLCTVDCLTIIFFISPVIIVTVIFGLLTFKRNQDYKSEMIIWQDTLKKSPRNSRAHIGLGLALRKEGKIREAKFHYRKALEIQPNNFESLINMGALLSRESDVLGALKHYQIALQINDNNPVVHNSLGNTLRKLGRFNESAVHYKKAIEIDPKYEPAYIGLGECYSAQHIYSEAIIQYRHAINLNNNSVIALIQMGVAYAKLGDTKSAILHLRKSLQIEPDNTVASKNLKTVFAQKEIMEKISTYEKLLESDSENTELLMKLGKFYMRVEDLTAARNILLKVISLDQDFIPALNDLAIVYNYQGKKDAASELLLRVKDIDESTNVASLKVKALEAKPAAGISK